MSTLGDRLQVIRRSRFVGRTAERELFQSALTAAELPFYVLHLFGPGGVGKTTLLREFMNMAAEMKVTSVYLDGRNIDPSPDFFLSSLQQALHLTPPETPIPFLLAQGGRFVIFIDTYEKLAPLDAWLRDELLPQLPDHILVVLAGRQPPTTGWRADTGWQLFMRAIPLRNFSPEESESFLKLRQVPEDQHADALGFTYGHPLALSLMADVVAQYADTSFRLREAPDIIRVLLDRFIENVPTPAHRAGLEACALVRLITEPLLAAMLGITMDPGERSPTEPAIPPAANVHELFTWLQELSFIESDRNGLFPHDLAREVLTVELRWRNPDRYAELHRRARNYYMARVQQGDDREQRRILSDYIFLHRDNPVVRPYFEWQEGGTVFTDKARPADRPAILEMVEMHEGAASARLAAYWIARQPDGTHVFRDAHGEPKGLLQLVRLEETTAADRTQDPAISCTWQFLQRHAPLRTGERATMFRFWMAQDNYQRVSPVQSRIFLNMVQHYLTTPGLAYTFIPCAEPDFWLNIFAYADLARLEPADYEVGGLSYGVYGHDWRAVPPAAWLSLLGEREITAQSTTPPPAARPLLVLSESDFATAVRDAFRDFTDLAALQTNPLLQSRLVVEYLGNNDHLDGPVEALRELVQETTISLQESPRQAKLFHALFHTYFQPAPNQEQAAELLDIPFGTYRRHLRAGMATVIERLWQQEIGNL